LIFFLFQIRILHDFQNIIIQFNLKVRKLKLIKITAQITLKNLIHSTVHHEVLYSMIKVPIFSFYLSFYQEKKLLDFTNKFILVCLTYSTIYK